MNPRGKVAATQAGRISVRLAQAVMIASWLPVVALAQAVASGNADELEWGRRIYTQGVLSSGMELTGTRAGRTPVSGAAAACVNCHRPSGMGQVEADFSVQPINGNFLFAARDEKRLATMDPHVGKVFNRSHDPYTDATLAAAIRTGVNSSGRELNAIMPRFNLSDTDVKAVAVYLKQLSSTWSPGVTATSIRFATVTTPDVDPLLRKVMVDMARTVIRQKNGSTMTAKQGRTRHHMTSAAELVLGTERNWDLDVWELQGAPETWAGQLTALYRSNPVFAIVSGASHSAWQPVHDFCDQERVPCWFPSVDLPGKNPSRYAFYFSDGVGLESAVVARRVLSEKASPRRVVQIHRGGGAARAAAQALKEALAGSGIPVSERILRADLEPVASLRQATAGLERDEAVMFWLRPEDIEALAKIKPVPGKSYFSAVLGGGEHAPLPAAWRARSSLVYPYELPAKRAHNLDYFHAWLNLSRLPLVDEAMQSEAFFAWSFLSDTISEMLDNVYRDYLLERAETMLSIRESIKSEQETRDRVALGRAGDLARRHGESTMDKGSRIQIPDQPGTSARSEGTTPYPHLSLGQDQRFASKGAYIVRFANGTGTQLVAESGFIVPR